MQSPAEGKIMTYLGYIACFFAGAFLSNAVPHFVYGVCGDRFPTPFAKPPGRGLSTAMVNVVWALFNLIVGWVLLEAGHVSTHDHVRLVVCFAGFAIVSILSSRSFEKKLAQ
jgi:hypothetical protein